MKYVGRPRSASAGCHRRKSARIYSRTYFAARRDVQETRRASRYEKGAGDLLLTIREMSRLCPVSLRIYIVQPGLSKAQVSREQLELLSVTETYLMETYRLPFAVIASA